MKLRKSLRNCVDGYLWEEHFKRIEKREYATRTYESNYRGNGWRHVVRVPKRSTAIRIQKQA